MRMRAYRQISSKVSRRDRNIDSVSQVSVQSTGSHSNLCPKQQTKESFSLLHKANIPLLSFYHERNLIISAVKPKASAAVSFAAETSCSSQQNVFTACKNPMSKGRLETYGTIPCTYEFTTRIKITNKAKLTVLSICIPFTWKLAESFPKFSARTEKMLGTV